MQLEARHLVQLVQSCQQNINEGKTAYPDLSFEHGVIEAIKWLMEMDKPAPQEPTEVGEKVTWH